MSIIEFVESLSNDFHQSDTHIKENALKKLSKHLSQVSVYSTNEGTVGCLVTFYLRLFNEHYNIIGAILEGMSALIDFSGFSDKHARLVASAVLQIGVDQLNVSVRLSILDILERLFVHHIDAMKSLDEKFVRDYMTSVSGENDPQCVLRVMHINTFVAENLYIGDVYEELFESVSAYFPVEFKTNKTNISLTRDQFLSANKQSMLASKLFGPQLFPMLMDKLTADMKSSRVDALDILADAVNRMNFEDLMSYYMSFMSILYHEYKGRDPDIQELVCKCLRALSALFQQKATEAQLLEFSWHLFELCYSGISNEQCAIDFMLTTIGEQPRVWCAVLAYFLPKITEKIVQEDLADLDRLDILATVLSSGENMSQYQGLVDNGNSKLMFTKASLFYANIEDFPTSAEDNRKMVVFFRLLALYSLFHVAIPQSGTDTNFTKDRDAVLDSQLSLVSKAINVAAVADNEALEKVIVEFVPKMVKSSPGISRLTDLIFQLTESHGIQSEISYTLLRSFPVSSLGEVLEVVLRGITGPSVRESASSCLTVMTERLSGDRKACDQLSAAILKVVECLPGRPDHLSAKNIENVALAIAHLGPTTIESSRTEIVEVLLRAVRHGEPHNAVIIWLCSVVGQSPIDVIVAAVDIAELLNMFLGLILINGDLQINGLLCQTYASVVNKADFDEAVNSFVVGCLGPLKDNAVFLLCLLKSAVHMGHREIADRVIARITDPIVLSTALGKDLSDNINMLSKANATKNRHFCTEEKLFPKQALFYEQQMFHSLAQKYRRLATETSLDKTYTDIAMEMYLKLVGEFSDEVLELSLDEVISTIVTCLPIVSTSTGKVGLQIQFLKSLSSFRSDSFEARLSSHLDDISGIIVSVASSYCKLSVDERLCLAKSIVWFLGDLRKEEIVSGLYAIRAVIVKMLNDQKRLIRVEAVKAKMLL